jgi:hypothetical protein
MSSKLLPETFIVTIITRLWQKMLTSLWAMYFMVLIYFLTHYSKSLFQAGTDFTPERSGFTCITLILINLAITRKNMPYFNVETNKTWHWLHSVQHLMRAMLASLKSSLVWSLSTVPVPPTHVSQGIQFQYFATLFSFEGEFHFPRPCCPQVYSSLSCLVFAWHSDSLIRITYNINNLLICWLFSNKPVS